MLIANVRENNQRSKAHFTINWGRGRLNCHESFFGFAAKFCRLNHLKPKQFREFWSSLFVGYESRQQETVIIARILDEPKSVVNTIFKYSYLNRNWPPFRFNEIEITRNKISFCPECLVDGYHGNFHESDWLKKCPIHRIDLACEAIPHSSSAKIDRYVTKLLSLLDLNCPGWEISDGKYRQSAKIKENSHFDKFLHWRYSAENFVFRNRDIVLGSFGCNEIVNYASFINHSNYLILLDKLGLIKLIPKDLYELFVDNELSSAIEIQDYGHDLVHELKKIQNYFQFDDLLSFFRLAQIVKGEELSFQTILDAEIYALKLQHPSRLCNCIWGINKRGELVNCLPGELKYFGDFMCPYEYAANELYDKWLNLMPDINFLPFDVFDKYAVLAQRAKFSETASVVGYSLGERIPIFKYNW